MQKKFKALGAATLFQIGVAACFSNCGKPFHTDSYLSSQKDSMAIAIAEPASQFESKGQLKISGSCASDYSVAVYGDVVTSQDVPCATKLFSASVELSSPDGHKTVRILQTDGRGNSFADSRAFHRDPVAPQIRVLNPAASSVVQN